MREPRRSPAAVRWLLAVALGLLGLAGAPAADALSAGTLSAGTLSAGTLSAGTLAGPSGGGAGATARTVTVRNAAGRASAPRPTHAATTAARHHVGPSAPVTPGAFASAGPDVRPALIRTVRPAAGFTEPVVAATGAPRGRAPPATTRI
jgi:hypothetical protein